MFSQRYQALPERLYARAAPAPAPAPKLLAWNTPLAERFETTSWPTDDTEKAQLFSGNKLPAAVSPIACAYAGHQFGQLVPQLGDGRALLLGDACDREGQHYDIQLKGAGRTAYSRGGDGRSALGPVLREYIVSEAMHALGVPTTRALAAVATGASVVREHVKPAGVLTRVAKSHVRVGTFYFAAMRGDAEGVQALLDYCIERLYPHLGSSEQPAQSFFAAVCDAQADLLARWMALGFVHGVMNTDNMAVSGETLDYGPCAFLDEYNADKVFSSIDHHGRYAFSRQPAIAQWNLARLAESLLLIDDQPDSFSAHLEDFSHTYESRYFSRMGQRLGLHDAGPEDQPLITAWLAKLAGNDADYHESFRALAARIDANDTSLFGDFEDSWRARLAAEDASDDEIRRRLASSNPLRVPRNHQIEAAIQAAEAGDFSVFEQLRDACIAPFSDRPEWAKFSLPPKPEERVLATFCGT